MKEKIIKLRDSPILEDILLALIIGKKNLDFKEFKEVFGNKDLRCVLPEGTIYYIKKGSTYLFEGNYIHNVGHSVPSFSGYKKKYNSYKWMQI